jgi:HEAT repeat protein
MMASLYMAGLLVQTTLGGLGHHAPKAGCCDACGVQTAFVSEQIARLQTCPRWKDRDHAAHELRHVDWRCHPEVVHALVAALLHDCDEEVREESAQSLAKLAPCVAEAHAALCLSARCDPDHSTRHWARKALAKLHGRGGGPCQVCAAPRAVLASPQPLPEPALAPVGSQPPPELLGPNLEPPLDSAPSDLPATLPGTSPFSARPPVPAVSLERTPRRFFGRPNLAPWPRGRRERDETVASSH